MRVLYDGPMTRGQAIAVDDNPESVLFGWLFAKHPDGQWVSIAQLPIKALQKEAYLKEQKHQTKQDKIMAAVYLINGLRQGLCPCGYMGTISPKGHCFKCGTQWDIFPTPPARL